MKNYVKNENDLTVTITLTEEEFENHFCFCADCGELLFLSEAIRIDGEYYCHDCVCTCDVCGTYIRNDDAYRAADSESIYCLECFQNECFICSDCGTRYRYEDSVHEDDNGRYYCDDCWEDHKPLIGNYHDFKDYGTVRFYGNADRRDELHIGWELEVDSNHRVDRERIASGVKDILGDFVTMENDGSLNYGFEIISQPATLGYHLSMMPKYTEACEYLTENEMLSHDSGLCGYHCHADAKYLGTGFKLDAAISKLLYLTEKYRTELLKFARRTQEQADSWCRSRKQKYTTEAGWIKKAIYENRGYTSYQARYFGLNLVNLDTTGTIEFRYFRGSLVPETIEASLKLVARLMEISKTVRAVDLAKMSFEDLLGDDPTIHSYWARINKK